MPFFIPALVYGGTLIANAVTMYNATQKYSYYKGYSAETSKYWDDYYKNTGYRPRYKYRSGYENLYDENATAQVGSIIHTGANSIYR